MSILKDGDTITDNSIDNHDDSIDVNIIISRDSETIIDNTNDIDDINTNNNDNTSGSTEETINNCNVIINIDSETGNRVYNNWTNKNITTVKNWKTAIAKSSFVCEVIKEKYNTILHQILVSILVLNGVNTILSAIMASLVGSNPENKTMIWVSFGFLILLSIMEGTTFILTGCIKIYNWNEFVNELSIYIQKMDNFYATVSSELMLPDKLRRNANDFITKQDDQFLYIMSHIPDINPSDAEYVNQKFQKFMDDHDRNFRCSRKYNFDEGFVNIV